MTPAGNFFEPWDLPRLHQFRKNDPIRYNTQDITTSSNKML